jgi:hypothetical protein
MSKYTIVSRDLMDPKIGQLWTGTATVTGSHVNEGTFTTDPILHFTRNPSDNPLQLDSWLFEIQEDVVPNWFGVAVPQGIQDFTKPHVFFHPIPAIAGYPDDVYKNKDKHPGWVWLYRYVRFAGTQLCMSGNGQVFIMPFFTTAAKGTCGVFAKDGEDILSDILNKLTRIYRTLNPPMKKGGLGPPDPNEENPLPAPDISIQDLVLSSFSAGIKYLSTFLTTGKGVTKKLREIYDLGGRESDYAALCPSVVRTPTYKVLRYDQAPFSVGKAKPDEFHLPLERWPECPHTAGLPTPPKTSKDVHALFPVYLFYHAWTQSSVG